MSNPRNTRAKTASWKRLDNAAKIFPPTSNRRDTKVFRFVCRLKDAVEPAYLQQALDQTISEFPLYRSIIRKGLFWYYFETSSLIPMITKENHSPCSSLYDEDRKNLLFEISYYENNINLEVYHALTDGTGALQFLRTLVLHYLSFAHAADLEGIPLSIDYDASLAQKEADSFKKHFSKGKIQKKTSLKRAYKFKGEKIETDTLQVINGVVSVKEALAQAHTYDTTLTVFLCAVYIYAIGLEMTATERKRPVVVSVPVNLRSYFQSASARNFFSVVNVPYTFDEDTMALEPIIHYLQGFFAKELTADKLKDKLTKLVALEHNYITRVVPLFLKKPTLRMAHHITNKEITTTLSNVGVVRMPEALAPYIDLFDVYVSTNNLQMCLCSYGDKLSINFTSSFVSTEVQKNFFRELSSRGITVTLSSNIGRSTLYHN